MPGCDVIGPPGRIMSSFDILQLKEHVCYQLLNIISTEWMKSRVEMGVGEGLIIYLLNIKI